MHPQFLGSTFKIRLDGLDANPFAAKRDGFPLNPVDTEDKVESRAQNRNEEDHPNPRNGRPRISFEQKDVDGGHELHQQKHDAREIG